MVEPATPYVHGWHVDAIADHLTAVTRGEITRLVINVPPGTMKSLMTGVFWPSWEWGPRSMASLRYIGSSYSEDYAKRDNRRMRDLVNSTWFQSLYGDRVRLTRTGETSFANDRTGSRQAIPFSRLTGGRGDRVIIDDPLGVDEADSPPAVAQAERRMRESVPTRVNDPVRSAIILIMQRVHSRDPTAVALEQGYTHLMLPMEFEPDRRSVTHRRDGSTLFRDPRTWAGELLFPARFPMGRVGVPGTIANMKAVEMTGYAWAGQEQQRPVPREGGLFKTGWFSYVDAAPAHRLKARGWDFGGTEGGGNPTATVLLSVADGVFYVEECAVDQVSEAGVETWMHAKARADGHSVSIHYPQDPGQAGKGQALRIAKLLVGYDAHAKPVSGSKAVRAKGAAAQAEFGNVKILAKLDVHGQAPAWARAFIEEVCAFPNGETDDRLDAFTEAFNALAEVEEYDLGAVR